MAPKNKKKSEDEMREPPVRNRAYKAPGRLGDPRMELFQDPRANVKLVDTLTRYGLQRNRAPPSLESLSAESTLEELGASMAEAEAGFEKLYEVLPNELPADALELDVEQGLEIVRGTDVRELHLHTFRPVLRGGPLPCIVYLHQGAMTISKTVNRVSKRWCTSLAVQGMVVIAVDFRNAWTTTGYNPFPAGLNDCATAIKWIHSQKDYLNIRNIVLQGDCGGANLALATAIKGNREGWAMIDGVYACAPCISNAYNWSEDRKLAELPSLVECHGYFCNVDYQAYMAHVYAPRDSTNPLAWPYHATKQDLEGLPPHVISVDELDPLRDEGATYYRKLSAAGVRCAATVNLGLTHVAGLVFRQALPEENRAAVRKIAAFAKSV